MKTRKPKAGPDLCADCSHERKYHNAIGCGIEQCGCQEFTRTASAPAPHTTKSEARAQIEQLALKHHKEQDGEYGCPGVTCPGVQRLTEFGLACAGVTPALSPASDHSGDVAIADAQGGSPTSAPAPISQEVGACRGILNQKRKRTKTILRAWTRESVADRLDLPRHPTKVIST